MSYVDMVWGFLLAIGPLILFHELGHYAVARLCGVKVLRFSIGMGKVVWSRRFGPDQTEWAISALPLGGYVKFLDDRDPATAAKTELDAKREFTRQSVWCRIAIVAAGPIANFILAIVVFAGLYMHGVPDVSTLVRFMPESSVVYKAGMRGGDRITAVNGEPVATWSELRFEVLKAALDKAEIQFEVAQAGGARFRAVVAQPVSATLNVEGDVLGALGLGPKLGPALIGKMGAQGAAERAGVKVGDVVTHIDGQPVHDGNEMIKLIQASAGRPLVLTLMRAGQPMTLTLKADLDAADKKWRIQAQLTSDPDFVVIPAGPFTAVAKASGTVWHQSIMQIKMIGKILTGALSWKNVTGLITIADYAAQTARQGPIVFLSFVAAISISLGVMNLLPIPVLDGGHLLYYSLEVLTGRPLPERLAVYLQQVGVVLLVMLMSLALFNDIARRL